MASKHHIVVITLGVLVSALVGACEDPQLHPEAIDRAEIEEFVHNAMNEEITVAETQATYEQLSDAEREVVAEILAKFAAEADDAGEPPVVPRAAGAAWSQDIENVWTNGMPSGSKFSSGYYVDGNCDDQPDDKEYVFYYKFSAHSPSSIRWTTTSSRVYLAFATWVTYSGKLLGFGYNYDEVRLCIGSPGVTAAGGADKVKSSVFVHY